MSTTTTEPQSQPRPSAAELITESHRVGATYRLAVMREKHAGPNGLLRAEATARLNLAAAIIALDEAELTA